MPFTPLHMGPGMALKAATGRHFSLISYGVAQVVMDIEPLVGILQGARVLHGPTHTYLAALALGIIAAVLAPLIGRPILRRWNRELSHYGLSWLTAPESFASIPVITGAFSGTLSHVLLDSLMHGDITPFAPWSSANGLLGLTSIAALHRTCILSGLLGLLVWLGVNWRQRQHGVAR